jgi:predicted lipoprotein with Yx(FWY)xxD motif
MRSSTSVHGAVQVPSRRGAARRWGTRGACALAIATLGAGMSTASAHAVSGTKAKKTKSAVVVQVVDRAPFGEMLATSSGLSLYVDPSGPCTGSCLVIWPPLLMPKGKTTPLGTTGLGTTKFGHRLQVTYNGKALYTFYTDTGSEVGGNGVQGFAVAMVG